MLNGRLALHDVDDVERFCRQLINRQRRGGYGGHDYEELLAWLIEAAWLLSERYDPSRGATFATFARGSLRVANWEREHFGRTVWKFKDRTYIRPRPTFVPLDDGLDLAALEGDPAADTGLRDLLGLAGTATEPPGGGS